MTDRLVVPGNANSMSNSTTRGTAMYLESSRATRGIGLSSVVEVIASKNVAHCRIINLRELTIRTANGSEMAEVAQTDDGVRQTAQASIQVRWTDRQRDCDVLRPIPL